MLCEEDKVENLESHYTDENALFEDKKDGMRVMFTTLNGNFDIFNRRELSYNIQNFPELQKDLEIIPDDVLLDGELVANERNSLGNEKFNLSIVRCNTKNSLKQRILSELYPITFVVFDILCYCGEDLTKKPLIERKELLDKFFFLNKNFEHIKKIEDYKKEDEKRALWDKVVRENKEGIIVKNIKSPYIQGRCSYWKKIKNVKSVDLKFTSYEINNKGITLISDEGIRVQCSGFQSKEVKERIDREGYAICEINYLNKTEKELYRQPTFKSLK